MEAGAWTLATPITVADINKVLHVLTVAEWQSIAPLYSGHCMSIWADYAQKRAATTAATTQEELAAL